MNNNIMMYKSRLTYKEIEPVLQDLSAIKYSIIKGEALSVAAYNATGMRTSSDVDILVSRKNLRIIEKKLSDIGFEKQYSDDIVTQRTNRAFMLSHSHQTTPFYIQKSIFKLSVDLNFDIFWGEYTGKRVDVDDFLSDTTEIEIYGYKVKVLPPLKAMVQLILHHYKDMNSIFLLATRNSIKFDMFKDIYYLLKNNINCISLDDLYDIGLEYDIKPYIYYVLYYTGLLFKDKLLDEYISAFKTSDGESLINCYGLNKFERHEWKYDLKTRLETKNIYELIKNDLTDNDKKKIQINKEVFG